MISWVHQLGMLEPSERTKQLFEKNKSSIMNKLHILLTARDRSYTVVLFSLPISSHWVIDSELQTVFFSQGSFLQDLSLSYYGDVSYLSLSLGLPVGHKPLWSLCTYSASDGKSLLPLTFQVLSVVAGGEEKSERVVSSSRHLAHIIHFVFVATPWSQSHYYPHLSNLQSVA